MEPVVLPAAQGWQWVLQGFRLFRAYAALWLLLLFFYWTSLLIAGAIPLIGPILVSLAVPGISAGLMVACRAAQQRQPPNLRHLFEPFAVQRRGQLQLGVVYVVCFAAAVGISYLADGGAFFRGPSPDADRTQMMRDFPLYLRGMAAFFLIFGPTLMAFWFSPSLVHWRAMAPAKALFFSFFACLRNWRAFLVYSLGWAFFLMVVPMFLGVLLATVLTPDMRGITVASFVVMPYWFAVMASIVCSFYPTYVSVFPEPDPAP